MDGPPTEDRKTVLAAVEECLEFLSKHVDTVSISVHKDYPDSSYTYTRWHGSPTVVIGLAETLAFEEKYRMLKRTLE
jgi:hypothetical protein